jgi:hypothetical protein
LAAVLVSSLTILSRAIQAKPFFAGGGYRSPFLDSPTPGRKAVAPAPMCEQKIGQMRF